MPPHHVASFLSLFSDFTAAQLVVLDGSHLTLATVAAVASPYRGVEVALDANACKGDVNQSRSWVEDAVENEIDMYGITTGFGACSDKRTFKVEDLQVEFVRFLLAGVFGPPASPTSIQPLATTRAAMVVRINSLLLGYSGIRWEVLEALAKLINANVIPRCPLRGSLTASGDLLPLCYVAGLLIGWPTVKAYHVKGEDEEEELVSAEEALKRAGIAQAIKLGAKEGLALGNGTCFGTAQAALTLFDTHVLFMLTELCSSLFIEVMFSRTEVTDPLLHQVKHHRGQIEVAAALHWLLQDSPLVTRGNEIRSRRALTRPRQDRYAPRSIPHFLGPQLECIQTASLNVVHEVNSANDNPLIHAPTNRCLHGSNFHGTYIGYPMDNVRIAVAAMGKLVFAEFNELMLEMTNSGLTGNLAFGPDFALDFGLKGVDIAQASYLSEMLHLANPVTIHAHSAEQHNQDVTSLGLISARKTAEANHLLKMMLASFIVALCQAVDLRHLEEILQTTVCATIAQVATDTGLPLALVSQLVEIAKDLNVLEYAHDACNQSLPLMAFLNTKLLEHAMIMAKEVPCNGHATTNGDNATNDNRLAQTITYDVIKAFKLKLEKVIAKEIEEARLDFLKSPQKLSNRIRGSKAFPLYNFVRKELKTEVITGVMLGCRSPDQDVQKVLDAITDLRILGPLQECFKGYK